MILIFKIVTLMSLLAQLHLMAKVPNYDNFYFLCAIYFLGLVIFEQNQQLLNKDKDV